MWPPSTRWPRVAVLRERGGRLFILSVGGSAGHAGHAVNDFRKLCAFEAHAPTDNVALGGFLVLVLAGASMLDGLMLYAISPRWVLLPLVLLALTLVLRFGNRWASAGLGALLLVAFVLSPEFVLGNDGRRPRAGRLRDRGGWGQAVAPALSPNAVVRRGHGGVALLVVAWLAANRALGDFVSSFRTSARDHALTGGYRVDLPGATPAFLVAMVIPFVLARWPRPSSSGASPGVGHRARSTG